MSQRYNYQARDLRPTQVLETCQNATCSLLCRHRYPNDPFHPIHNFFAFLCFIKYMAISESLRCAARRRHEDSVPLHFPFPSASSTVATIRSSPRAHKRQSCRLDRSPGVFCVIGTCGQCSTGSTAPSTGTDNVTLATSLTRPEDKERVGLAII